MTYETPGKPEELPLPTSTSCRYSVNPVATSPRPADPSKGITADMIMPIHPNTQNLGERTPILSQPTFPYNNCFFWIESEMSVRVKVSPNEYDDRKAIKVGALEHLAASRCWVNDWERMDLDAFPEDLQPKAEEYPPAVSNLLPYTPTILTYTLPSLEDDLKDSEDSDTDKEESEVDESHYLTPKLSPKHVAELQQFFSFDPFGWDYDPQAKFLPLVDLWLDLEEHLAAEEIPNPLGFYKEQNEVAL